MQNRVRAREEQNSFPQSKPDSRSCWMEGREEEAHLLSDPDLLPTEVSGGVAMGRHGEQQPLGSQAV
jgi:hypothetical protein